MTYPARYQPDHPLSQQSGIVRVHRVVLWEKLEGRGAPCHWCGRALIWRKSRGGVDTLCVDHIDGDPTNNDPNNLVPSCKGCNVHRDRTAEDYPPRRTHCINGHEYTPENTYMAPKKVGEVVYFHQACRTCIRASRKRSYWMRKRQGIHWSQR